MYGWYSKKQYNINKKSFFYTDLNNNIVEVTSVNSSSFKTDSKFDDIKFICVVCKFIDSYQT